MKKLILTIALVLLTTITSAMALTPQHQRAVDSLREQGMSEEEIAEWIEIYEDLEKRPRPEPQTIIIKSLEELTND